MCGVSPKDRCRNSDIREWCGLKENVVTRVEKGMFTSLAIWEGYLYDVIYNVTVDANVDQILEFQESNDTLLEYPTRVHVLAPADVTEDHPLFVTATQQRGVSSWELPLVVRQSYRKPTMFREMARTLCPYGLIRRKQNPQENYTEGRPRIQLSTWSPQPLTTSIKLRRVAEFYLRAGPVTAGKAAPGTPSLYYYDFEAPPNASVAWNAEGGHPSSVLLYFESDDELCAIVSVQDLTVRSPECVDSDHRCTRVTAGGSRRLKPQPPPYVYENI
ncbi:SID1 transmembrane family member 1 [Eumeta japonica]|uniref:SID1 transmembrane family member 1 n=1 Tax=Eumeta variegata TaxID=151549 RepID=A0A4C1ZYY1_EUMVA|nr:SID1 transmembrane family member 1 [Eumeta japonica]